METYIKCVYLAIVIFYIVVVVEYFLYLYKSNKFWKKWRKESFDFNGSRFSKQLFEVIDGKIEFKNDKSQDTQPRTGQEVH